MSDEVALSPATPLRPAVGMEVVGNDIAHVGEVAEVREGDFLVRRPLARDLYAPLDAVRNVTPRRVVLAVASDEVDLMDWPDPPLVGDGEGERAPGGR